MHRNLKYAGSALLLTLLLSTGNGGELKLNCGDTDVYFSEENGSITRICNKKGAVLPLTSDALFRATGDRNTIAPAGADCRVARDGQNLIATYRKNGTVVRITATPGPGYLDLQAEVNNGTPSVIKEFHLPARLHFSVRDLERLIMPGNGMFSVGFALEPEFFREAPLTEPIGYQPVIRGDAGFRKLLGGSLEKLDFQKTAATRLTVTEEGKKIFSPELTARINASTRKVHRPPSPGFARTILINSPDGPFLSGNNLGGSGNFWQFGGWQETNDTFTNWRLRETDTEGKNIFIQSVLAVIADRANKTPDRKKIVLFSLHNGPLVGNWGRIKVVIWENAMRKFAEARGLLLVPATSATQALKLLKDPDVLAFVNPYSESLPVPPEGGKAIIPAIWEFVRKGGNWFESGGYPFYAELRPLTGRTYSVPYPAATADFQQFDGKQIRFALYSVQPLSPRPWDPDSILETSTLSCGGGKLGWLDRSFMVWIEKNEHWKSPVVRMRFGSPEENLNAYCADNDIRKTLEQKMPKEMLQPFKDALFLYAGGGDFRYTRNVMEDLPVPVLLHSHSYLRNGFDASYPDHFPFDKHHARHGEITRELQKRGQLVMPYSNSSWWCETTPRPPTFAREGEAPLLKRRDGKPNREHYGYSSNPKFGFTTTMWHPAVRKANDKTITEFQTIFPVSMLFQDQVGVRINQYDFNPASPSRTAYVTGLINQARTDSARLPITTEGGYAHLVNYECAFFGMGFGLIPNEFRGSGNVDYHAIWPANLWKIYPMAQRIMHDKLKMHTHNLNAFSESLAVLTWQLGLGFNPTFEPAKEKRWVGIDAISEPKNKGRLDFLSAVQKEVTSPWVGKGVVKFEHRRPDGNDTGIIDACYGNTRILANLNKKPLQWNGMTLAPNGYHAARPGMRSGALIQAGGRTFRSPAIYVASSKDGKISASVFTRQGDPCALELPEAGTFRAFRLNDGSRIPCETKNGFVFFTAPKKTGIPADCMIALSGVLE